MNDRFNEILGVVFLSVLILIWLDGGVVNVLLALGSGGVVLLIKYIFEKLR